VAGLKKRRSLALLKLGRTIGGEKEGEKGPMKCVKMNVPGWAGGRKKPI